MAEIKIGVPGDNLPGWFPVSRTDKPLRFIPNDAAREPRYTLTVAGIDVPMMPICDDDDKVVRWEGSTELPPEMEGKWPKMVLRDNHIVGVTYEPKV